MSLFYRAALPQIRRVTAKDHRKFQKIAWNPHELVELKMMNHKELLGLMAFCGVRTYNGMPVIACTDDELRMAYLSWRGHLSMEARAKIVPQAEKAKETLNDIHQGVAWWIEDM